MPTCPRCDGCRWVCEAHPERPWEGQAVCGCGAPGAPCPVCNQPDEGAAPELPEGYTVDTKGDDWN
jgi:hypothetical protein